MSILKQPIIWIVLAACLAPIWGTLLWELWDGAVRPRLIRRDIIDRAAAAILAEHGERAEQMAWIQEDRAWRYSDPFKQGGWRRLLQQSVGWAKARQRRAHHLLRKWSGGHATGRIRARRLCPPYTLDRRSGPLDCFAHRAALCAARWLAMTGPPLTRRHRSASLSAQSPSGRRLRHSRPGWPRSWARSAGIRRPRASRAL
ncbi:MAG: hypothetical protein QOJ84_3184 [Bradyrhizobium sp.]|nr:hypothetical protein [Bradyrhizobium sp.]